jgi:5'-methylthioadenosine phosphorylase
MFAQLGGDVVGMTNVPEVTLAREAGICYAAVAVVANWAAGMSKDPVRHSDIDSFMAEQGPRLNALLARVVETHRDVECSCRSGAAQ